MVSFNVMFTFWFSKLFGSWARFPSPAVAESLKMGVYGKVSATGLRLGDVGKQPNSVGKVDGETNKVQTSCDTFQKKGKHMGMQWTWYIKPVNFVIGELE